MSETKFNTQYAPHSFLPWRVVAIDENQQTRLVKSFRSKEKANKFKTSLGKSVVYQATGFGQAVQAGINLIAHHGAIFLALTSAGVIAKLVLPH